MRLSLTHYYHRDEEMPILLLSLDWYVYEDYWYVSLSNAKEKNLKRWKNFGIFINLFHYHIELRIKLKHIGLVLGGIDRSYKYDTK